MDGKRWPSTLTAKTHKLQRARKLIENHLHTTSTKARYASLQGHYSETIIVSLQDKSYAVLQYRAEPLDPTPFLPARQLLGDLVPIVEILHDQELQDADIWPVYLSYIPGDAWAGHKREKDPNFNIAVMKSLGKVLSKCFIEKASGEAVQSQVIPKLKALLAADREEVIPFTGVINQLIEYAPNLSDFPLFLTHLDLNAMNIMTSKEGEICGIVDWELSPPPTPFGMSVNRIHDLAGYYQNGIHYERNEYREMEKYFWEELINGAPKDFQQVLRNNPEAIQRSIAIGTILFIFDLSYGGVFNKVAVRALPKLLTYRLPQVRGKDPPYAEPPC